MISRQLLSGAYMHMWPHVYYYARVITNNQGNYASTNEGGQNNCYVNKETAGSKLMNEAGLLYSFLST